MEFIQIKRLPIIFLSIGAIFLLFASRVSAMELELPLVLEHAGLTFEQPLVFSNSIGVKPKKLEFGTPNQLTLKDSKEILITDMLIEATPTKKLAAKPTINSIKKPSPTLTKTPTKPPTPTTSAPSPTAQPTTPQTQNMQLSNGGLNADVLFNMSNTYRAGRGLPAFQKDDRICSLAVARAPQISAEISGGHMHSGKNSHNFPYSFTENIITMRSEAEAFNWWVNDYIHRVQIEANNTHSCVACSGNACVQEFTNFQPK